MPSIDRDQAQPGILPLFNLNHFNFMAQKGHLTQARSLPWGMAISLAGPQDDFSMWPERNKLDEVSRIPMSW